MIRSAEEFVAELRALSGRYWGTHPFHQRMHAGELTRDELRTWAANRWYYQSVLPRKDAAIIENCPLPEIRRTWLDRVVYHDGRSDDDLDSGRERWLRLCAAVGLTREEVLDERHVVPGVRFAVDAYVNVARTRARRRRRSAPWGTCRSTDRTAASCASRSTRTSGGATRI